MSTAPDYLEPFLAYRFWSVQPFSYQPRLISRARTIWHPHQPLEGRHLTTCGNEIPCAGTPCAGHIARGPFSVPKCGIYGMLDAQRLQQQFLEGIRLRVPSQLRVLQHWSPLIMGAVWLWGRYAKHTHGYRAQFAYPAKLFYAINCDGEALAEEYGIAYQEDKSWTSAMKSREGWQSPFGYPYHIRTVSYFWGQPLGVLSAPSSPILPPSNLNLVSPPKWRRRRYSQQSFRIHAPTGWYWDASRGLWLRVPKRPKIRMQIRMRRGVEWRSR